VIRSAGGAPFSDFFLLEPLLFVVAAIPEIPFC
jgi:hypothetical protein